MVLRIVLALVFVTGCAGGDGGALDASLDVDAAQPDAALPPPDASADAQAPDASLGPDAAPDAGPDAAPDAMPDAGPPPDTLTVTKAPDETGFGSVTSAPAGLACGPGCVLADAGFAPTTRVTLEARPEPGSYFAGWTGACAGSGRVCTVEMAGDVWARARFSIIEYNLVFATSERYAGDLGGLAGADAKCMEAAASAGISGHFVALLSTDEVAARDRLVIPGTTRPVRGFVRLDGRPIADTVENLFDTHVLWYPVLYDEDGNALHSSALGGEDMVWTGTTTTGPSTNTCDGWTSSKDTLYGNVGQPGAGPAAWLDVVGGLCNPGGIWGDNRLYCFMVDKVNAPPPPAETGKRIYLTQGTFAFGGRVEADRLCTAEMPAGVKAARALLATTDMAAAAVLDEAATYVRPDGALVGTGADIIAASRDERELASGVWQTGAGEYVSDATARHVWTGVAQGGGLDAPGTAASTCDDWAAADPMKTGASADFQYRDATAFTGAPTYPCYANLLRLYCVEL